MEMRILSLILLGVAVGSSPAGAYPIPPQPLWNLVTGADVVVLATVGRKWREVPVDDEDAWRHAMDRVALAPIDVLKGTVTAEELVVEYSADLSCPAPPHYQTGKRVLTFLRRTSGGRFAVLGLSWGTQYPEDNFGAFKARIREALVLQSDPPVSEVDKVDWHIRTAAEPATRWDGLWPLVRSSRPDDDGPGIHMLPAQLRRLRKVFLSEKPSDGALGVFLMALARDHSKAVDAVAIAGVGAMDPSQTTGEERWLAMVALLKRLEEHDLLARLKAGAVPIDAAWAEVEQRHRAPTRPKPRAQTR